MNSQCVDCGSPLRKEQLGRTRCDVCVANLPPEVKDTGIFKTVVPQNINHLIHHLLERDRKHPFLRATSSYDRRAADEISAHKFPAEPKADDLLSAAETSVSVYEAYRLRQAYEQMNLRLALLLSDRGLEAIAQLLAAERGEKRRDLSSEKFFSTRWISQLVDAAVAVGYLGQRLEAREREPDARRGRKAVEHARAGGNTTSKRYAANRPRVRAEYARIREEDGAKSRTAIAKQTAKHLSKVGIRVSYRTVLRYTA